MKNVAFIINPNSAKKEYHQFLNQLKAKVENPLVLISKSIEDSQYFIKKNWDSIDIFVAFGGDGTLSSIAKELINTEKILAAFPGGSGNGFATELSFSKNLDELLSKINKKSSILVDTFTVNNNFSMNISGVGFDGAVAKDFEKTSRGLSNYAKVTIKNYMKFSPISIQFESEFSQYNGDYLMINVANTRQFGNGAYIVPHADFTDGIIEIALVKKFPFYKFPKFAYQLLSKKLIPNQYLKYISTSEISFEVNSKDWHLDGEYKELNSPIQIKVQPKSLRVLV